MENIETNKSQEFNRAFKIIRGSIPNSIEVRLNDGGYTTMKDDGRLYPMLNDTDPAWKEEAIKNGMMAQVIVSYGRNRLYFPNYANSTIRKILSSPANTEIDIPKVEDTQVETDSTISVYSIGDGDLLELNDSINNIELKIECPRYQSFALVKNGKFEIIIVPSEEENRDEIKKYFEEQILLYAEKGVICEIPYFRIKKDVVRGPFGGHYTDYYAQFPDDTSISDEERGTFPKTQLVVNVAHPLVIKSEILN